MNTLQKYEKYFYLIILIGIIIYFPIFFNGFVWDDWGFIINNPQVYHLNLSVLFGKNDFNNGPFYRPIPAVYFAFLYSLSGAHAFLYHLAQLVLHLTDTSLLFLFYCTFFSEDISFFLVLLFLVHPINVESVAFIGATQSELYFLPGITALLLGQKHNISKSRFIVIVLLLLASIFTKETGALFLLLLIGYRYFFKLGKLREFFIAGVMIAALYLLMRIFFGGVTYSMGGFVEIATVPFLQRLLLIPAIFIYYLKTFLFPLQLAIWQMWVIKTPTIMNFFVPLFLTIMFFISLFGLFRLIRKKESVQTKQEVKPLKKNSQQAPGELIRKQFLFFSFLFGT